jgi:hypothetical protein
MSEFDPLTAPLAHLFTRIDAALPSDPVLAAAAEYWLAKRRNRLAPTHAEMITLPAFILPHVFEAHLMINGDRHWGLSMAGSSARSFLGIEGHDAVLRAEPRMAVRLRRLFDLVADKGEPHSASFDVEAGDGGKLLVEIYAAPLAVPEKAERAIFAVINGRREQVR